jgi:hypothetical protein
VATGLGEPLNKLPKDTTSIFESDLKTLIEIHWSELAESSLPETMSWGAVCLDLAHSESSRVRNTMEDFYSKYPEYEGDLERFVSEKWQFQLDDFHTVRQHEFVLLAWERSRDIQFDLSTYGTGENHPLKQYQKDNRYQWRRFREDEIRGLPYTFDRLDSAYKVFQASSDFRSE